MKVYKENGLIYEIDRSVSFLSSWLYLWVTSFENAKKELKKIWKQAP
jgi:hypothetical protein